MIWTDNEIQEKVNLFPRWHYQFELGGVVTPIHDKTWINRHYQRKRYFFDPLARSGFILGKRVLDLGCNAGYYNWEGYEDFLAGDRLAFVCTKHKDLDLAAVYPDSFMIMN